MVAEIKTSGTDANSWLTITEANVILAELVHPSIGAGFQLEASHIPHIITAARMISDNWWFKGEPEDEAQTLAWPRKNVPAARKLVTADRIAAMFSYLDEAQHRIAYQLYLANPDLAGVEYLPDGTPQDVKRAQAYLAAFLVKGVNLWDDTKYNAEKVKLGSMELTSPKNAVAEADIVFQALAKLGTFKGSTIVRAGGSR